MRAEGKPAATGDRYRGRKEVSKDSESKVGKVEKSGGRMKVHREGRHHSRFRQDSGKQKKKRAGNMFRPWNLSEANQRGWSDYQRPPPPP